MDQLKQQAPVQPESLKPRAYLLFGIACVVLITLFVTAYSQVSSSIQTISTLERHTAHLDAIDGLLNDLLSAETGVRGYLITGKRAYLESYAEAVSTMDDYLEQISSIAAERGVSQRELDALTVLTARYMRIFAGLITDKREGARVDLIDIEIGKTTFDEMHSVLANLKTRLAIDTSSFYRQALASQERSRWIIFSLCSVAFVLLLVTFATLQRSSELRQRLNDVQAREKENLEMLVLHRTQQLTKLAANLTRVNEAEKKRLARELHDDLGASLTAARMDATWVQAQLADASPEQLAVKLQRLIGSLDQAITLKRRITNNLLPPLLSELGLFEALRSLADDLQLDDRFQVQIELPQQEPALEPDTQLALFRITQEALTNVRKYSQARRVGIAFRRTGERFQLAIEDDGVGFDPAGIGDSGFGLTGMQHRAQMIEASLEVTSAAGQGTRIEVCLPAGNGEIKPR